GARPTRADGDDVLVRPRRDDLTVLPHVRGELERFLVAVLEPRSADDEPVGLARELPRDHDLAPVETAAREGRPFDTEGHRRLALIASAPRDERIGMTSWRDAGVDETGRIARKRWIGDERAVAEDIDRVVAIAERPPEDDVGAFARAREI